VGSVYAAKAEATDTLMLLLCRCVCSCYFRFAAALGWPSVGRPESQSQSALGACAGYGWG